MTEKTESADTGYSWLDTLPAQEEMADDGRWDCEEDGHMWMWTFRSASGVAYFWFTLRGEGEVEKPALEEVMPHFLSTPPF